MNKNIKLAVAGAVLALSATAANAGIIIPAGEWTIDINGNVNAFAIMNRSKATNTITGAMATVKDSLSEGTTQGINTGLLPAWLGFTGTTRQNDLDVSFTISMQPGVSGNGAAGSTVNPEWRQANVTFGDKSWGSIKLGKDLGIFASDAILNDMTLLGVGAVGPGTAHPGSGTTTTYGGIGTGYIYAAWKGQVSYTTPNMNGFQATVGITNPNQTSQNEIYQDRFGLEGKASYSFAANDTTGKVWVSGASYKNKQSHTVEYTGYGVDIGANVNVAGFGLTGYYYNGEGMGTTTFGSNAADASGNKRDSDGGYLQATYALPTKTKVGIAYGVSNLDKANDSDTAYLVDSNERITVGVYHPLTKHLNLVAEYSNIESKSHNGLKNENNSGSLGAILFF
jgi:predicted porin